MRVKGTRGFALVSIFCGILGVHGEAATPQNSALDLIHEDRWDAFLKTADRETEKRKERFHFSSSLREQVAVRLHSPVHPSLIRTLALPVVSGSWTSDISYRVSGRFGWDGAYAGTSRYSKPVRDDQRTEASLRDAYIDFSRGNWDTRIGKQSVVWGEAVGLFFADVVNAKDLREFVLPEFDQIRTPEWGTTLEYSGSGIHAEFVWIPLPEMDRVGRPGSEFEFTLPAPAGFKIALNPEQMPSRRIENSEVGSRLSVRQAGWDLSLFALRSWNKFPIYLRTLTPGTLAFTPTHPRATLWGTSFAKEISNVVFKGEAVYNAQTFFQTLDALDTDGAVQRPAWDYLLGADHTFLRHVETSLQFSQRWIDGDPHQLYQQRRLRTQATASIRIPVWKEIWRSEFLIVRDLNAGDTMWRPKVSCKWGGRWRFMTGFDLFNGPRDTLFGQFANRDRLYSELSYEF